MKHCFLYIIENHGGKITAAFIALYVAVVTSLPAKKEDFNFYDFMYSVSHALIPIRVGKPNA